MRCLAQRLFRERAKEWGGCCFVLLYEGSNPGPCACQAGAQLLSHTSGSLSLPLGGFEWTVHPYPPCKLVRQSNPHVWLAQAATVRTRLPQSIVVSSTTGPDVSSDGQFLPGHRLLHTFMVLGCSVCAEQSYSNLDFPQLL